MKLELFGVSLFVAAGIAVAVSGCGTTGPAPLAISQPPLPTATPAGKLLYVDHNGIFYEYALPLERRSKPLRTLTEWPGATFAPTIAADQYGNVALANAREIRLFNKPIVSFAPSRAKLKIKLTPAITNIGQFGAELVDIEFDPHENLWLLNELGSTVSELRAPLSPNSIAALSIAFGVPGSKTAGFTTLVQARFDVNATLYVYASSSTRSRLFKIGFPYAKPPGSLGINLAQADFVDASQWPPTARNQPSLLLGQYFGALHSPPPGSPPPPPVDVTGEFTEPLNPQLGLFPNAHINTIVAALVADPYRARFYALDALTGSLEVYGLPMRNKEKAQLSLRCLGGPHNCSQLEHLFIAP